MRISHDPVEKVHKNTVDATSTSYFVTEIF